MSPMPVMLEDHWAPQPGTDPGRPELMWFMRVGHDPQIADLARIGQERLADIAGLDLLPLAWLHMTTLIAGYADEIQVSQVDAMIEHARSLLARTPPAVISLGRVLYHPRAIMLAAEPPDALGPVLSASRGATRAGTGRDGRLHRDPWVPHISLAYSNSARPAGPAIEALGRSLPSCQVAITSVSLISQAPSQKWTWNLIADIPFGTATAP